MQPHTVIFLCQPVVSHNVYNADTEPPTAEDESINSISDSNLLSWEKYLRCLRKGAWGDHIALQGIVDMLSIKINALSSHYPLFSVLPSNCNAV